VLEAGILPTELLPLRWLHKHSKMNHLLTIPKLARVRSYLLAVTIIVLIYLIRYSAKTLQVSLKTDIKTCRDFSPLQRNLFKAKLSLPLCIRDAVFRASFHSDRAGQTGRGVYLFAGVAQAG